MDGSKETELKVVCSDRDALASSISSTSSNDESKAVSNLHKLSVGRIVVVKNIYLQFVKQSKYKALPVWCSKEKILIQSLTYTYSAPEFKTSQMLILHVSQKQYASTS